MNDMISMMLMTRRLLLLMIMRMMMMSMVMMSRRQRRRQIIVQIEIGAVIALFDRLFSRACRRRGDHNSGQRSDLLLERLDLMLMSLLVLAHLSHEFFNLGLQSAQIGLDRSQFASKRLNGRFFLLVRFSSLSFDRFEAHVYVDLLFLFAHDNGLLFTSLCSRLLFVSVV